MRDLPYVDPAVAADRYYAKAEAWRETVEQEREHLQCPTALAVFVTDPRFPDDLFVDLWRACFPDAWEGLAEGDTPTAHPRVLDWRIALAAPRLAPALQVRLDEAIEAEAIRRAELPPDPPYDTTAERRGER